jgi:hypothetical protein
MYKPNRSLFLSKTILLLAVMAVFGSNDASANNPRTILAPDPAFSLGNSLFADTLAVNESKTFTIKANEPYNYTHVKIENDKTYKFTVASPAWNNGEIETDAEGYPHNKYVSMITYSPPRHISLNFMALIGEIFNSDNSPTAFSGHYVLIGLGPKTWKATKTGFLVAFANDCLHCYADNSRVVTLTVKRTA